MRKQFRRMAAAAYAAGGVAGVATGVWAYQQAAIPPVVVHQPDPSGKADVDELIRTIEEGRLADLPPEDRPQPLMLGVLESG